MNSTPYANNSILVLTVYYSDGLWMFDDDRVGLCREPFVEGVPEIIEHHVKDIHNAEDGFRMIFSAKPFPGYQEHLVWQRAEYGGNWYLSNVLQTQGWLCPAMYKYFEKAPENIYVKCETLR
ncbi:DUF6717 family protein [Thiorhodospira sibirica]|uniref:DUF6717 family protein n=1 Tax=Thiorhodospira sibirica TaxID=154347 RepID=UPI00022C5E1B|nr:DUF6717 family protein [Thiorhodospira sibirica]